MKTRPTGHGFTRESKNSMADFTQLVHVSDVKLSPEDIPGSMVDDESTVAKWTVDKLKFWLKCRRLNQQGSKKSF